jgi:hypothetical protein
MGADRVKVAAKNAFSSRQLLLQKRISALESPFLFARL